MQPSEYFLALRKHWLTILASAVLGTVAAGALAVTSTPTYRATSSVFVSVQQGASVSELAQGANYSQALVQSFTELTTMPIVLDGVIEELGLTTDARTLAQSIEAANPLNTVIIEITATTEDPDGAAALANTVASELADTVDRLAPQGPAGAAGPSSLSVSTVSTAPPPNHAASPNTRLMLATGFALGLALGATVAVLRQLLDTRVRTSSDVERLTAAPVLAQVARFSRQGAPLMQAMPESAEAESYRRLRTNLTFYTAVGDTSVITVTSAVPAEGKSTTAANLALAFAERRGRVLLIDGDLRRPTIAETFGLEGAVGLTTILIGHATVDDAIQAAANGAIDVLPAGAIPPNALQLLDSRTMAELLQELRGQYDVIVIDTPPVLPVADTSVLARQADGALIVARAGHTRRPQLRAAVENLEAVGAMVMGVVLGGVRATDAGPYTSRQPYAAQVR